MITGLSWCVLACSLLLLILNVYNAVNTSSSNQPNILYPADTLSKYNTLNHSQYKKTLKKKRFGGISQLLMKNKEIFSDGKYISVKEAKELFRQYYDCREKRVLDLLEREKRGQFPIQAVVAVVGLKQRFHCPICYRPDVDAESQKPVWEFLRLEDTSLSRLVDSDRVTIDRDGSLVIKDIEVKDAGQYFCLEHHSYAAVWMVDVALKDNRIFNKEQPPKLLPERNLKIFTRWGKGKDGWSDCNRCGRPGEKFRYGNCWVEKINKTQPIKPRDFTLMSHLYPDGVPCRSTALPAHIRILPEVKERKDETHMGKCWVPCPTKASDRVVTDPVTGEVVEVLMAGRYSLKEKLDIKFEEPTVRKIEYRPEGTHLILRCPGIVIYSGIYWQRGEKDISPIEIRQKTKGRILIDLQHKLHIRSLIVEDSATYSCWDHERKVAKFKVLVQDMTAVRILGRNGLQQFVCKTSRHETNTSFRARLLSSDTTKQKVKGLRERLADGESIICAEGYMWELERRGFVKSGSFTPEVVLDYPERVISLHEEYVLAGSDVVEAYTYYGHRARMKGIGREDEVEQLNLRSLAMARQVADKYGKLMAGNLCNTTVYDPNVPDSAKMAADIFQEQIEWAVKGTADYMIAETFSDVQEALIALDVIKKYGNGLPIVVTLALYCQDQTTDDVDPVEALRMLEEAGADVVGLNCARGPATMLPILREARKVCKGPLAGLPVPYRTNEKEKAFQALTDPVSGEHAYPLDLACVQCSRSEIRQFAEDAREIGIQYVGLCCGSSSNYLRELAMAYGRTPPSADYAPETNLSYLFRNDLEGHSLKVAEAMRGFAKTD